MAKRWILRLFKLIGVGLFLIILSQIDRDVLISQFKSTNMYLFGSSFIVLFLIYYCKAERFGVLTKSTNVILSRNEYWKIFNIGVFLAGITPGKIGEIGRAAYLKKSGIKMPIAIAISILDRIFDILAISIIGTIGTGVLFGWQWSGALVFIILFAISLMWIFWKLISQIHIIKSTKSILQKRALPSIIFLTFLSWGLYFLWAILIALSVHIYISIPILVAAFTYAGMVSLLPIAPSGLGTRDATLLILLAPYGATTEQIISLSFLMFISTILGSLLGGYYLLRSSGLNSNSNLIEQHKF